MGDNKQNIYLHLASGGLLLLFSFLVFAVGLGAGNFFAGGIGLLSFWVGFFGIPAGGLSCYPWQRGALTASMVMSILTIIAAIAGCFVTGVVAKIYTHINPGCIQFTGSSTGVTGVNYYPISSDYDSTKYQNALSVSCGDYIGSIPTDDNPNTFTYTYPNYDWCYCGNDLIKTTVYVPSDDTNGSPPTPSPTPTNPFYFGTDDYSPPTTTATTTSACYPIVPTHSHTCKDIATKLPKLVKAQTGLLALVVILAFINSILTCVTVCCPKKDQSEAAPITVVSSTTTSPTAPNKTVQAV